jgi:hypothetical protein
MSRSQNGLLLAVKPALFIATWIFLLSSATALHGQTGRTQFQCAANVTAPAQLRGESYADLVGDITLVCTGGAALAVGAPVPTTDITIFLNTLVTSRTYAGEGSEALLIIDEPGSGLLGASSTQLACTNPTAGCSMTSKAGNSTYDGSSGQPNIFPGVVQGNSVIFLVFLSNHPGPRASPGSSASRTFAPTRAR